MTVGESIQLISHGLLTCDPDNNFLGNGKGLVPKGNGLHLSFLIVCQAVDFLEEVEEVMYGDDLRELNLGFFCGRKGGRVARVNPFSYFFRGWLSLLFFFVRWGRGRHYVLTNWCKRRMSCGRRNHRILWGRYTW